jgi:hypothetical protein
MECCRHTSCAAQNMGQHLVTLRRVSSHRCWQLHRRAQVMQVVAALIRLATPAAALAMSGACCEPLGLLSCCSSRCGPIRRAEAHVQGHSPRAPDSCCAVTANTCSPCFAWHDAAMYICCIGLYSTQYCCVITGQLEAVSQEAACTAWVLAATVAAGSL